MLRELEIWQEVSVAKIKVLQLKPTTLLRAAVTGPFEAPRAALPPPYQSWCWWGVPWRGVGGHQPSPRSELASSSTKTYCGVEGNAARLTKRQRKKPTMDEHRIKGKKMIP